MPQSTGMFARFADGIALHGHLGMAEYTQAYSNRHIDYTMRFPGGINHEGTPSSPLHSLHATPAHLPRY